ncbi:MAG: hypothetical protein JNJ61_01515 [Anaerolineae bacterium]|nr:hypothetical protein [Anaerolineae bacterium]
MTGKNNSRIRVVGVSLLILVVGIALNPTQVAYTSLYITPTRLPPVNPTAIGSPIILDTPLETPMPSSAIISPSNVAQITEVAQIKSDEHARRGIFRFVFSQDGNWFVGLGDTVQVWKMPDLVLAHTLPLRLLSSESVAVSPDGRIIAIGNYEQPGWVELWDITSEQRLRQHQGGEHVRSVAFNGTGTLLLAGRQYGGTVWDVASGDLLAEFPYPYCDGATFHPYRDEIAVSTFSSEVDILQPYTGAVIRHLAIPDSASTIPPCAISSLSYSPDGTMLAAGMFWEHSIALWDDDEYVGELSHKEGGSIWQMAWSPDGRLLAVVEPNAGTEGVQLVFWDIPERRVVHIIDQYAGTVSFSPDGSLLVISGIHNQETVLRVFSIQ